MSTKIEICCMSSLEEVQNAMEAGANSVGFVCATPTSLRTIDIHAVKPISSFIPPSVDSVLLTSETNK